MCAIISFAVAGIGMRRSLKVVLGEGTLLGLNILLGKANKVRYYLTTVATRSVKSALR
jgi:hypothetical protein